VFAQQSSVERDSDGALKGLRGTRDGSAIFANWVQSLILEGRGFGAGIGLLSAAEALPNAQVITTLRPTLWIDVPDGTAIVPFFAAFQVEDTGGDAALEATLGLHGTAPGAGTSDSADYGPVALRSDAPIASNCSAYQEATGDVSSDPNVEVWRVWKSEDNAAAPATSAGDSFEWRPKRFPVVVGAGGISLTIGGDLIPIVSAQIQWVEIPESAIT
jgi:hypothetical protein